jgi:hypothetical protein
MSVEGGEEKVVVESFRSSWGNRDVTAEIYFVDQKPTSSGPRLSSGSCADRHCDRGGTTHDVLSLRPALSVSPDGRWILSTQGQEGSDLMLVDDFR